MSKPPLDEHGLPRGYRFQPDWEVTPRAVRDKLQAGEPFTLLDVRRPDEHAVARIESSTLLPMQELGQRLGEIESMRDQPIVVFCHAGVRSMRVTQALRQQGFTNVFSMAGGIDLWSVDIDPSVPRY